MPNKELIQTILKKWRNSPTIKDMKTANRYYAVENEHIHHKNRNYVDADGNIQENKYLSNVKIPSAFLRMSVDQKVDYAFGKPFLVNVKKKEDVISDELKDLYQKEWNNFISPINREEIKDIAKNAVNCGIGWCYPVITQNGEFRVSSIESDTVYPRWTDKTHTELISVVRDYFEDIYKTDKISSSNRVEYWDKEVVEKYTCKDMILTEESEPTTHFLIDNIEHGNVYTEAADVKQSWGKVPFIALKSCRDEKPLLKIIKSQIDSYDELQSKSVDGLIDDIDPVLLLKGMSAEIKDLAEARYLIKNLRIASVESDGDARYIQVNPDISATQTKLENLEKDIKEFSCTVSTQDIEFGSNPSGIALKAAYQDLDIFINKLETQFEVFMQNLKYFFDTNLIIQGKFTEEELANLDITVTLDRDMMINETELIENTSKLSGLVSQETLDNYNPAVESHEIEQERRDKEKEDQENKDTNDLFNFPTNNMEQNNQEQENQNLTNVSQ